MSLSSQLILIDPDYTAHVYDTEGRPHASFAVAFPSRSQFVAEKCGYKCFRDGGIVYRYASNNLRVDQFSHRLTAAACAMAVTGDVLELSRLITFHPAVVHSLSLFQETPIFQVFFLLSTPSRVSF